MPSSKINEEIKKLLNEFVSQNIMPKILDKDNLLAILTYGSSLTGFSSKNSDIDLLIVVNKADSTTRGVKIFQGKKIEYFIKPIGKFFSESEIFAKNNCPSHVALNENAYFLYDRGDLLKNILNSEVDFYNENRERPKDNYDLKLVQIENRIANLKNVFERDGKEFHMVYFNTLEMIRTLHSKRNDEAEIPFAKAYRIYTDKEYYNKFVSAHAHNNKPDEEFVKLYTICVEEYSDKAKMLKNIENLYQYEQKFYKINPNDYEINLD